MNHKKTYLILLVVISFIFFNACRKEALYKGNEKVLIFNKSTSSGIQNTDTLNFDTVFTTIGTVTRQFRVNNTSDKSVLLDIILKNLDNLDTYRINVDGKSGHTFKNIEIPAKDYIYIFVEATLGKGNINTPFILMDEIEYRYNNVIQKSYLEAWGQDAYFHTEGILINSNVTWLNDKPHIILNNKQFRPGFGVDSNSTLTIQSGCKIYTSFGKGLYVDGHLYIGTAGSQDSVIFQSTRIETLQNGIDFKDNSGLWQGIYLFSGSQSKIYNTRITQAVNAIQTRHTSSDMNVLVDNTGRPNLIMDKVIIRNSSLNALLAINSNVKVTNSIFYATGSYTVAIALGGIIEMDNCTIFNNGVNGSDASESLIISNVLQTQFQNGAAPLENAIFTNCIIYGGNEEILALSKNEIVAYNYSFINCLLKSKLESQGGFVDCIFNENPLFENASEEKFHLKENSPCINTGKNNGITEDIYFNQRNNFDIGAIAF